MLLGYWTHSGFLNWDSGLGLKRWQIGKTFAFAQQGLLAIARADDFHARPEFGAWAKYFFDRGLGLYTRWADEEGGGTLAPAWLNGVHAEVGGGDASKILFGARMAANAARAIDLGLGERAAQQPPPFYAYDPDIGRLAVSTPSYSTAVLAANHGAVGYGGIELARLYDGDGRPVATIGGRPPAAFGVVVRDVANRTLLASQISRLQPSLADPPLRLTRAPRGTGRVVAHPRHAYAAPFQRLDARGAVAAADVRIVTAHRFRAEYVESTWTVSSAGRARRSVDVLFPAWTGAAQIDAVLHDGTRVALGRGADLARAGGVVSPARRAQRLRGRGRRPHADARDRAHAGHRAPALRAAPRIDAGAAPRARRALPPAHAHRAHRAGPRRRRGRAAWRRRSSAR